MKRIGNVFSVSSSASADITFETPMSLEAMKKDIEFETELSPELAFNSVFTEALDVSSLRRLNSFFRKRRAPMSYWDSRSGLANFRVRIL